MNLFLLSQDGLRVAQQDQISWYILLQEATLVADQIEIIMPLSIIYEKSTFTVQVYFRTRATKAASTPTTIHYRVDDITNKRETTDWTSIATPATRNAIVITVVENTINDDANVWETKQLTIKTDDGLSTQVIEAATWKVRNLTGVT